MQELTKIRMVKISAKILRWAKTRNKNKARIVECIFPLALVKP